MFQGKTAIVTGAASGIGEGLAAGLGRRGARVVVADVAEEKARSVAAAIPGARAVRLDVTDAAAVQALVDEVAAEHGTLDYMFNNAGIAIAGELLDVTLEDWKRTIDVDLWGVIYGVHAAYRVMARQRSGHIVNTASVAGLAPSVAFVPYAAAKHAVVGLSTSLRVEAAAYGVKISVACPGFVDTGMRKGIEVRNLDREKMDAYMKVKPWPAQACAEAILRGVERNDPVIVVTGHARLLSTLYRWAPGLYQRLAARELARSKAAFQIERR